MADGYYEQAITELQALADWNANHAGYRQDLAEAWHGRGTLYMFWKGRELSMQPFVTGRTLRQQLFLEQPKDPRVIGDLARSHGFIGDVELDLGRVADALPHYERALKLYSEVLGEKHPDTLTSLNNYAIALHALGRTAEALPHYERVLMLRIELLGIKHPDTLNSFNSKPSKSSAGSSSSVRARRRIIMPF